MFSQSDFLEWKNHPVTQHLYQSLRGDLENISEAWRMGSFLDEVENARQIGITHGIQCVLNYLPIAQEGAE
jgi:hypothetical protein